MGVVGTLFPLPKPELYPACIAFPAVPGVFTCQPPPNKKNEQASTKNPAVFFFGGGKGAIFFLANRDLKHEILVVLNL